MHQDKKRIRTESPHPFTEIPGVQGEIRRRITCELKRMYGDHVVVIVAFNLRMLDNYEDIGVSLDDGPENVNFKLSFELQVIEEIENALDAIVSAFLVEFETTKPKRAL